MIHGNGSSVDEFLVADRATGCGPARKLLQDIILQICTEYLKCIGVREFVAESVEQQKSSKRAGFFSGNVGMASANEVTGHMHVWCKLSSL